ncbi:MAG: hypothetical protein V4616_06975 [Bacteroidota bacterium]
MYELSDSQIEFIHNDIAGRGISMEHLQNDLVDHVCCILEHTLEPGANFEHHYQTVIKGFYEEELAEIERETKLLLTFKNYYIMKKMLTPVAIAALVPVITGTLFKIMHWPGANLLLVCGSLLLALLFFPLLGVVKAKETTIARAKWENGLGATAAALAITTAIFKILHWPYATVFMVCSVVFAAVYLSLRAMGMMQKS